MSERILTLRPALGRQDAGTAQGTRDVIRRASLQSIRECGEIAGRPQRIHLANTLQDTYP